MKHGFAAMLALGIGVAMMGRAEDSVDALVQEAVIEIGGQEGAKKEAGAAPAAATVEPAAKPEAATATPDISVIRRVFQRQVVPFLAGMIQKPQDVTVSLSFDPEGRASKVLITKGLKEPRKPVKLDEKTTREVDKLLKDLGAAGFQVREKATAELKKIGAGIVPQVRKYMAANDDPEVQIRCRQLTDELDGVLDLPRMGELLTHLKSLSFSVDNVKGQTFVVPVTERELQSSTRFSPVHFHGGMQPDF